MNTKTITGEDMTSKETTIFKCADSLFRISQELYDINKDISQTLLLISDRLLKEIEASTSEEETFIIKSDKKMIECEQEICTDCGGIKNKLQQTDLNTTCSDECCFDDSKTIEFSSDPSKQCHGHDAESAKCKEWSKNTTKSSH